MMNILTNRQVKDVILCVCCRWQRHFQSYKCESCHSSLNGTAVCTQLNSHLKSHTAITEEEVFVKDSAHLPSFFFNQKM